MWPPGATNLSLQMASFSFSKLFSMGLWNLIFRSTGFHGPQLENLQSNSHKCYSLLTCRNRCYSAEEVNYILTVKLYKQYTKTSRSTNPQKRQQKSNLCLLKDWCLTLAVIPAGNWRFIIPFASSWHHSMECSERKGLFPWKRIHITIFLQIYPSCNENFGMSRNGSKENK